MRHPQQDQVEHVAAAVVVDGADYNFVGKNLGS